MKNMGVIARSDKQFKLIYSSKTRVGRHTLSYLTAIQDKLLAIDLVHTKVSDTQWAEIAADLGVKIGDLVDKRILDMPEESTAEFGSNDWLKIIQNNDEVITKPIAINGKKTKQISNPSEVMQFFDVDSAGIEHTNYDEEPRLEGTSDNENFIEKD